jgi:hypothetical protein
MFTAAQFNSPGVGHYFYKQYLQKTLVYYLHILKQAIVS